MDGNVGAYFRIYPQATSIESTLSSSGCGGITTSKAQKKSGILVSLGPQYWPGQFLTTNRVNVSNTGVVTGATSMMPAETPTEMNNQRKATMTLGSVTISIT